MNLKKIKVKFDKYFVVLIIIIAFGSFLRFYNLNWDKSQVFHPDEMNIDIAVGQIKFFSKLNPHFFQYNGLPIYLYYITGELLNFLFKSQAWALNWGSINLIGRFYSALFSSLAILLIYKLSLALSSSKKTALLTSLFLSLTVSLIQTAHFAVTESLLIFFLIILAILTVNFLKKPSFNKIVILGLVSGASLAVKTTALLFLIIPLSALTVYLLKKFTIKHFKTVYFWGLIFLLLSVFGFFCLSPYNFLDWKGYRGGMLSEKGIISGTAPVPWNYQFINTKPYLFQFNNLFWQMGITLPIISLTALLFLSFKSIKINYRLFVPLIFWTWIYFFTIGRLFVKFNRYFIPLLPFFCLFSAHFLYAVYQKNKTIGSLIIISTAAATFIYASAFFSIYLQDNPRFTASQWIFNNIPANSLILTEDDDHLYLPIHFNNAFNEKSYRSLRFLGPYRPDNQDKLYDYAEKLAQADYLILANKRLYGAISRLKKEFPITSYYYQELFNGNLGYQKIIEFPLLPSFFGFKINDSKAEETFLVFDHPKPIIFKNTGKKDSLELITILEKGYHQL